MPTIYTEIQQTNYYSQLRDGDTMILCSLAFIFFYYYLPVSCNFYFTLTVLHLICNYDYWSGGRSESETL